MSLSNAAATSIGHEVAASPVVPAAGSQPVQGRTSGQGEAFVDRRQSSGTGDTPGGKGPRERRQFGSSHKGLSEAGKELALAIDRYKLQRHRRYITCDELLMVISQLGYRKTPPGESLT
jgi:hypothetical protein